MTRLVILDTRCGRTAVMDVAKDRGRPACDCERRLAFGVRRSGPCSESNRFLVIASDDPRHTYWGVNQGYPEKLLFEFEPYWELQKGLK